MYHVKIVCTKYGYMSQRRYVHTVRGIVLREILEHFSLLSSHKPRPTSPLYIHKMEIIKLFLYKYPQNAHFVVKHIFQAACFLGGPKKWPAV